MANPILKKSSIETPLGTMVAIADNDGLYLLEFLDCPDLVREEKSIKQKIKSEIVLGCAPPIELIESELNRYFKGNLREFKTPLFFSGTPFQKKVWEELKKIPYGETRSYLEIAKKIGKPTAFRAVAQANGANLLSIIVPCHRVINTNGQLGGYAGGVARKQSLLEREKSNP